MKFKIKSVKHESILKQFYIYFIVASVIPLIVLIYLIYQFATTGKIDLPQISFKLLIGIAAGLSLLGFWGTRAFLTKIVALSNKLRENAWEKLDRDTLLSLAEGEGEIAHLARAFSDITGKLEKNIKQLEDTKKTLYRVLFKIGKAVSSTEKFDVLIQFTLETIVDALGAKRGLIYFIGEGKPVLEVKVASGIDINDVPSEIKFGEDAVGWVAKEKKPLFVPLLEEKRDDSPFSSPLIAAPLVVHDKLWGVISLSGKTGDDNFSEDDLKILSNLAYQIAVSFENVKLNEEAERTYFETMSALAFAVEAKDTYSRGHSERVSEYAIKLATALKLSGEDLETIRDAAKLHDIGKIGIIDEILHKPGRLSYDEEAIMHKHPLIGEGIVKPLKSFYHIIDIIKHHHEFLDGTGYPDGLKGDEISLITRILTVSDIYDALTTDRPYRKAFSIEDTKKEIQSMADRGKIDKNIVATLMDLIDKKQI